MNSTRTACKTLIAILAATGLATASALAQQASPGGNPTAVATTAPGSWPGPCPWASGQGRGGWNAPGDGVASQIDRMAWRLNLTAEQKAKLEPVLRKRDELRATQRQAMRQEIAAILTPEQLTQFERMGPGRGRGMGPGTAAGVPAPTPAPAPAGQP